MIMCGVEFPKCEIAPEDLQKLKAFPGMTDKALASAEPYALPPFPDCKIIYVAQRTVPPSRKGLLLGPDFCDGCKLPDYDFLQMMRKHFKVAVNSETISYYGAIVISTLDSVADEEDKPDFVRGTAYPEKIKEAFGFLSPPLRIEERTGGWMVFGYKKLASRHVAEFVVFIDSTGEFDFDSDLATVRVSPKKLAGSEVWVL